MSENQQVPAAARTYRAVRMVAVGVSLVSVLMLVRALPIESLREALREFLNGLGPWGPIAFVFIYILATVAMLPASVLTLLGAAVFGFWIAYAAVTVGSVIGAAFAFLIARYAARKKVEQVAKSYPKFAAIDEAISEGGWRIVALLRLSPAVPFNLQNYLYGLTKIRFWPYVLVSWLAMIPGTMTYVYLGHAAGQAVGQRERTPVEWVLLGLGVVATITVTVYVTRIAKRKLAEQSTLATSEPPSVNTGFPRRAAIIAIALACLATIATSKREAIADLLPNSIEQEEPATPTRPTDP